MRLTTTGTARHIPISLVGRITTSPVQRERRSEYIFLAVNSTFNASDLEGYKAVISQADLDFEGPAVDGLRAGLTFADGDIIAVEPDGFIRSLYRPREKHHSLFVTERCSSNCLMCSQPPKDSDDVPFLSKRNQQLIELMDPAPEYLTITGGEPTLLGVEFFALLEKARERLPNTAIHVLSNGRTLAWGEMCRRIAEIEHPALSFGIPLYSDSAGTHDYIVQAKGAFDQTVAGFHQAARYGIRLEVRIVLHALSVPRVAQLAEFIYRNLPMVEHVALMGLEFVGYTARNISELWIDPFDYQDDLLRAVSYLSLRDMNVSIYNHQLCVLRPELWKFAVKSISDWKNLYLPECESCSAKEACGGLFQWASKKHSAHLRPIVS